MTVIDWCIQDGISVWITRIVWTNLCIYIGMFYGELNYNFGQFLLFVLCILFIAQISFGQMVLSLKAILVFKGELIDNFSERTLLWGYRLAVIGYMLFLGTLGMVQTQFINEPRDAIILELMTSSKEPT